jgi:hypothetical protein
MRFVNMYFIGFTVFLLGVVLALWKVGILERVGATWIVIGAVIALGIGLMMSISSGKPDITHE